MNPKWIACPDGCDCPVICRRFDLSSPVRGEIRITGLGFFVLRINGKRVSDNLFTPALTDYEPRDMGKWAYPLFDTTTHRILYLRYDVTPFLKDGENVLEVQLGPGWYRQRDRIDEGRMAFGSELKCWFDLSVTGADGTTTAVASDGTEQWRASEILRSSLFVGETVDLSAAEREPVYAPVSVVDDPKAILEEQTCPADRVIRTITPKYLTTIDGRRVYDAGENITGRVAVAMNAGTSVTLRYSEELFENGALDFYTTGGDTRLADGSYQIQCDTFRTGSQAATVRNEFTWHGFRYFDVEGGECEPTVEVIHTDAAVTSKFTSADPILNWLYEAYVRGQLGNLHDCIPSDCPHRERLGYTGDGEATAKTAMMVLDMRGVYRKWIRDILDCQDIISGHVQHTAPAMGGGGGPGGWGCAMIIVPDEYDRHYNDRALLEECYPHMVRWIGYLKCHTVRGLVRSEEAGGWCLGDWASVYPIRIPEPFVNSCFMLDCLRRMTRIAAELDHPDDATAFAAFAEVVRTAIIREYCDAADGSFCGGVNGADAYAVRFGLDDSGRAMKNLVKRYSDLGYFDTGFLGTEILMEVLISHGEADLAYELLTSEKNGSYGYLKNHGATTIWEYLTDHTGSHNHPMFGAPVKNLLDGFLGIRQPDGVKAYAALELRPQIPEKLAYASGSVTLPSGRVDVRWTQTNGTVEYTAVIPENVPAALVWKEKTYPLTAGENKLTLQK